MNRCLAAFLALLFASLTVSSACLAEPNDEVTIVVPYGQADLSTPPAVKALHRRIGLAANRVCLDVSGPSPGGQIDLGCRADALAGAHAQIERAIAQHRSSTQAVAAIERPLASINTEDRR